MGCLSHYRHSLIDGVSSAGLFSAPPLIEFRPSLTHCPGCDESVKVQKTRTRTVSTLHVGKFRAHEVILVCEKCGGTYRSEELCKLVAPSANFGYDVLIYAGKALFLRHRNEEEVVSELAERNVQISPREVSLLSRKFIVSEDELQIVPFLERITQTFGIPLALVHDMGAGILKAVAKVFPHVPDFICHFHFLRDIGKDFLAEPYDIIRKRLHKHQISSKLRYRAKHLKGRIDQFPGIIDVLKAGLEDQPLPALSLQRLPLLNGYTLIGWALDARAEGDGYGFPFDLPHLAFAKRLAELHTHLDKLKDLKLRSQWKDNQPYFKILVDLKEIINDKALWKSVEEIERKITVFERLRQAMRIAPLSGRRGLNDEGGNANIGTLEDRVNKFCAWLTTRKDYPQNQDAQKMIQQIHKYWGKLFADPITVETPSGPIQIHPQRTNNLLEQFFRYLKRAYRRKTGNGSSSRWLRTMLAETPLVKNLQNPDYMKILLKQKATLEELFAEIEITTLREEFRKAQLNPEKIPAKIKRLIAIPDYPEKLLNMIEKAVA